MNHPDANQAAGCKPEQLTRAAQLGLRVPPTLVSNDAESLREFAAAHGPRLICKPLYEGWITLSSGERGFWTSPFSLDEDGPLNDLGGEPYLFQSQVEKAYDVRVTVIGSDAYAVGIDSQVSAESTVDWRRGDVDGLGHWVEELPEELSRQCIELVAGYGLLFGAIDLARRPDGTYVFFELNPNGQWAWLEHRTGLPLRSHLADLLLGDA